MADETGVKESKSPKGSSFAKVLPGRPNGSAFFGTKQAQGNEGVFGFKLRSTFEQGIEHGVRTHILAEVRNDVYKPDQ